MQKIKNTIYILFLLGFSTVTQAEILVLVHGWSANENSWIQSGIIATLATKGWSNAGIVISLPNKQIKYLPAHGHNADKKVYRVHLPAEAPLQVQTSHLLNELNFINKLYPDENIHLVGHSAGGVVSRLALIKTNYLPIVSLITIASPNLGTPRALDGLDIVDGRPFFCPGPGIDIVKRFVGGNNYHYLRDSRSILIDLRPVTDGSLLNWLNNQTHPKINYYSLIRQASSDNIVPAISQDLNQIPTLQGQVKTYLTPTSHALNRGDALVIADILNN